MQWIQKPLFDLAEETPKGSRYVSLLERTVSQNGRPRSRQRSMQAQEAYQTISGDY